ncbi:MAG: hypothetical protein QOE01_2912 [Actinomycetota bacterium]|jgi:hypothetical protein|nr:hypothetical protein [Actinomycetota bacterium]
MNIIGRAAVALTIGAAAAAAVTAPALADQAYPAPGFPSGNASCVGAGLNYLAHYGGENDTFPAITHGAVGPSISGFATSDPGSVGSFTSALAASHGTVWECLP